MAATNVSLNVRDSVRRTALHHAAGEGSADNVVWLLDQGADADALDASGDKPLTLGLRNGHWHLVPVFSKRRGSPLESVVRVGRFDMLQKLVVNGSEAPDGINFNTGQSALFAAAEVGRIDMLAFLLADGADITRLDNAHVTPLASAALAKQTAAVKYLLEHGAPIDQRLQNRSSVLHWAALGGSAAAVEALLGYGANIEALDDRARTALHRSSSGAVTEALLRHGARTAASLDGLMPEHSMALAGHGSALSALLRLRRGAADARSTLGDTPLHLAALANSVEAARTLLVWCADPRAANLAGTLAYEYASNADVSALIRDAFFIDRRCQCDCGSYLPGPLFSTVAWAPNCSATVRCLLDRSGGTEELVQCLPSVELPGTTDASASSWSPARPTFACQLPSSGAHSAGGRLAATLSSVATSFMLGLLCSG